MYNDFINWLSNNQQSCFFKKNIGIDCPGCGFQRALIELLKGNLLESLRYYPALIPFLLMIIMLILHLIFNFKNGARILKYLFIFNVAIIFTNFVVKIIQQNIF